MPPRRDIVKAASAPVFTMVLFLSIGWAEIVASTPNIVKYGVLSILGALAITLATKQGDVRGSIRKGIAAVILGTVLPMLARMRDIDEFFCYVFAFGIGLCIDYIAPLLQEVFIDGLKTWFKK